MVYEFDHFQLDSACHELRRGGRRIDVQPKVMRLLCHLIEARERAVGSEELMQALWPNENVGDGSLKRAVCGARHILGEPNRRQGRIRTIRGFGYQFVGPLKDAPRTGRAPTLPHPGRAAHDCALRWRTTVSDDELIELVARQLALSADGPRCVLFASSGPGFGKTHTLERLLTLARVAGIRTSSARCGQLVGHPTLGPFCQVLQDALCQHGLSDLHTLLGPEVHDLAEAVGQRSAVAELVPGASLHQASTPHVFEGVAAFLRRVAMHGPMIIALDDLERADAASLRLLTYLVQQLRHSPVLFVATLEEPVASECLEQPANARLLDALAAHPTTQRIAITGLSQDEVRRYVALATSSQPHDRVVQRLWEASGGNALFLRCLVAVWRSAKQRGELATLHAALHAQVRGGLGAMIDAYLELAPERERDLLRIGAVLGSPFAPAQLAQLAGHPRDAALATLAASESVGIVRPYASEPRRYSFTHDAIRGVLYQQLTAAQKVRLHHGAATYLEQHRADASAEIAWHYARADPARATG